jgi:hypothetical protein
LVVLVADMVTPDPACLEIMSVMSADGLPLADAAADAADPATPDDV